jgi:hypothetical protein
MTTRPLVQAVGVHLEFPFHLAASSLILLFADDTQLIEQALDQLWEAAYLGYERETLFVRAPALVRPGPESDLAVVRDLVVGPALTAGQAVFVDASAGWHDCVGASRVLSVWLTSRDAPARAAAVGDRTIAMLDPEPAGACLAVLRVH